MNLEKAKIRHDTAFPFHSATESRNLIKIAIFQEIMAIFNIKIYEFGLQSAKYSNFKIRILCCSQNYEMGFKYEDKKLVYITIMYSS